MCYELLNQPTAVCRKFSRQSFAKALELARYYGWRPLGTQPPSIISFHSLSADWSGTYFTNDGQTVKTADALALAHALHKSLDDIPDQNIGLTQDTSER